MRSRTLLESPSGDGTAYQATDHDLIGPVHYDLQIWQQNPGPGLNGLIDVNGKIEGIDLFPLVGEKLLLKLEDGRSIPIVVRDLEGHILGAGDIQEAEAD